MAWWCILTFDCFCFAWLSLPSYTRWWCWTWTSIFLGINN